jgi:signal transduction histidine kinase/CheY-like chemotaxis protein
MHNRQNSIRRTFIRILIVFVLIIAIAMLSVNYFIYTKNKNLIEDRLPETKNTVSQMLDIHSSSRKSYAEYNSYWDRLVTCYETGDTVWTEKNFFAQAGQYNIQYIWFEKNDLTRFQYYNDKTKKSAQPYTTNKQPLYKELQNSGFKQFFKKINDTIVEIFVAPIQSSTDINRESKPTGYLIIGTDFNNNYLAALNNKNADIQFDIQNAGKIDVINVTDCNVTYYRPIKDEVDNTISWLRIIKSYPDLKLFRQKVNLYMLVLMGLITIMLAYLYFALIKKIYQPIDALSKSLKSGDKKPIDTLLSKENEFGELARLTASSFDQNAKLYAEINQRKNSELKLQEAMLKVEATTIDKVKAEQSAMAKTEFLSTISHEIRTPINGVIGIINLLKDETLNPRQTEFVNILDFSSKHLLSLVSDVLDFSKIESGSIEFEKASFDLNAICINVYNLFKPKADEKHLDLLFEPFEADISSLYGDHVRLSQILTNLLGNAIKFTPKGTIQMGYKIVSSNKSHVTIEFFIKDTGIGIDADQQKKIFESFSQANVTINREFGGTGLGLTISKKLVEMQGGSIALESQVGKGSTFSFFLTFEKHAFVENLPEPRSTQLMQQDLQGLSVLVAEDNKINTFVLQKFLQKWNVDYKFAVTGVEAYEMIQEYDFDVVLMDLQMPEMDGQEATNVIRKLADVKKSRIPIIALTADAAVSTQELLLKNGFNHFITKPFNPDSLFKVLKKYYV